MLVYGRLLGRAKYQDTPRIFPDTLNHIARTDPRYDALVLVSAFSTFQTKDMNDQVLKAFRTVHLGRIHKMAFLKYMFIPSNNVQVSEELRSLLQPAVKTMLTTLFPSMSRIQPIGVRGYVNAVNFALGSTNVGRSRMVHILGNIYGLQDEHLSAELLEYVWEAVAPCFDFYKKKRWVIAATSARVIDGFTKFLSLRLSNAPECYNDFAHYSQSYADGLAPNWLGGYLFLLVHSRRRLDAESLDKSHNVLEKFSDLLQYEIDKYKDKFTQDAITRAQLCIELVEEFQNKNSTAIDPALLTGLKHIVSIKTPYVPGDMEKPYYWLQRVRERRRAARESLDQASDQTTQKDTPAVDSVEAKDGENPVQLSTISDSANTSISPVNKED
ncbi:hypothetical protein K474DRAFT_1679855 [Panus rudis PR-1116 ss-1]|nr:hypothetical protein K474DRAFT_1679855 [Panus rudis PR-1116 ss-1]